MSWWANNRTRCRKTSMTALEAFTSNDKRHSGGVRKEKNMKCSREYMFICLFYCTRNREKKNRIENWNKRRLWVSFIFFVYHRYLRKKKNYFIDYLFVVDEWNDRHHQYHLDQPRELHRVERLHLEFRQRATNDYS